MSQSALLTLCDRAMVRKSTFYKHFGDKYELLAFVVRQKQESLNARLAAQRVEGDTWSTTRG